MNISPMMGRTIVGMAIGGAIGAIGASAQPDSPGLPLGAVLLGGGAAFGAASIMIARNGNSTGPFLPLISGAAIGAGIVGLVRS